MIKIPNVAPRGIVRGYERDGLFGIEEVMPLVGLDTAQFNGRSVAMDIPRYRVFRQSCDCSRCGVQGKFFALERGCIRRKGRESVWVPDPRDVWHLNLYGFKPNGIVVMLTKDHIIPTSRGGSDEDDNLVTMCAPCNERKGNRLPGELAPYQPNPPSRKKEQRAKGLNPFTRFEIRDGDTLVSTAVREEGALETFRSLRRNGRPNVELFRIVMTPVRTKIEVPADAPAPMIVAA